MADERPPIGGDADKVIAELRRMEAKLDAVRADVSRLKADRGTTARQGRSEGRAVDPASEGATGRAIEDTNRKLADRGRIQKQVTETTKEQQRSERILGRADSALGRSPRDLAILRQETGALAQVQAGASREMRKHGALTTEFLSAAARGDATLGEFRYQVGATIGKFAGWTAAGAAVFGVLGAIRELGSGAIDALNGVNLLSRVMPELQKNAGARGAAGKGLVDLSEQFNLPIADVSEAAFGFAQVYKNVPEVLNATQAALYAVKVGELDAAEATKLLISTGQGLGATGGDLVGIFDQINQAQNVFGVRIRDTVAGAAKASGAFRAAGGDFSTLLALITTGSRVSGRTGEQLGTALQRSAGLVQRPINQQILRGFGVDPGQNISDIYKQSIAKAQGLTGREQLQLARGLSTPQLAPYLVGILQHPDLFNSVLQKTSPGASKGSAKRELDQQLKSAREQLDQFGNSLQRIGADLAQLGAFDVLGAFLKTLNLSLSAVDHLLRLLNEIPGPLRKAAIYGLEFYGAMRLAQRFNVGGALVGTRAEPLAGYLQQDPLKRGKRSVLSSLRNEQAEIEKERERVTQGLTSKGLAREKATIAESQSRTRLAYLRSPTGGTASLDDIESQTRDLQRKQATVARLNQEIADDLETQNYHASRIQGIEEHRRQVQAHGTTNSLLDAEGNRIVPPPGQGPPTPYPPQRLSDTVNREAAATSQAASRKTKLARDLERSITGNAVFAGASRLAGGGMSRVAATASRAAGGAAFLGQSTLRAVGSLGAMLGPLDIAILGFIGMQIALDNFGKRVSQFDKLAENQVSTSDQAKARFASAQAGFYKAQAVSLNPIDALGTIRDFALGISPKKEFESDKQNAELFLKAQRRNPIRTGKPNYLLGADTLGNQINQAKRLRDTGAITLAEYDARLATALDDVKHSAVLTNAQKKKLATSIRDARLGIGTLSRLETPELNKLQQAYSTIAGSETSGTGQSKAAVNNAARVLAELSTRLDTRSSTPADAAALAQATDDFAKTLSESAQKQLKRGLLYARTLGQQEAAFNGALSTTRGGTKAIDRQIRAAQRAQGRSGTNLDQLRNLRQTLGGDTTRDVLGILNRAGIGGGITATASGALAAVDGEIKSEKAKNDGARERLRSLRRLRAKVLRAIADQEKELADKKVENTQEILGLQAQIAAAGTYSEVQSSGILLQSALRKYAAFLRQFGRDDKRTLAALLDVRQAQVAATQAAVSSIGANFDINIAQARDPVQKARLGVDKIRAQLGQAKGDQRKQLLAAYYDALAALDQARLDEANAEFDLRKSKTNDPLKQAQIQLQQDAFNVRNARGKTARLQALAQQNRDRFAYTEAKVQDKIEEAEFLRSIGKLSNDAEAAILRNLLTQKGLSKSTRHQIRKLLYDLTHDDQDLSSYELKVGNIRLPTTYEVRRAAQEAQGVAQALKGGQVNQTNTFHIRVDKEGDEGKVFDVLDQVMGTSIRSDLRSQGNL